MKSIWLGYGKSAVEWTLSGGFDLLDVEDPKPDIDPERFSAEMHQALENAGPDLSRVGIVVADKTRLCAYPLYLPILMDVLKTHGAPSKGIRVFIAYGTHPRQSEDESAAAYGESYGRFDFVHHDATDPAVFEHLGETSRKTPVRIRKDLLDCTFIVTFGAISHHYFAGYGGGRKLIFPGLGYREAVYRNHALFLDTVLNRLAPGCRPGLMDGNPVAEDLAEYEAFFPAHLAVHGILNSSGNVCRLFVGKAPADFKRACASHARHYEVRSAGVYPWVLASCGGHPKDINFIQSHKAIQNASRFVEDGGTLVVLSRCPDGVGSQTLLPYFSMGGFAAAFKALCERYEGNGGTALSMMEKTNRIRILMVTDLEETLCRAMGVEKLTADAAQAWIRNRKGSLAVLPNAGLLVRVSEEAGM